MSILHGQQQQKGHRQLNKPITGAVTHGGLIQITATAHTLQTGDGVTIANVGGTVEANGTWTITVTGANTFDLVGSTFTNLYTSGGTATRTHG
jgi:hypothetical protein